MDDHPRVLIVDDDPGMRTILELTLSHRGFRAFSAPTGQSALLQLQIVQPDLVILDLLLPGMDGWGILKKIRQVSSVPVMILTGEPSPGARKASLAGGANDFMTKPVDMAELHVRARALVQAGRSPAATGRQEE